MIISYIKSKNENIANLSQTRTQNQSKTEPKPN